jgi:protein TonB
MATELLYQSDLDELIFRKKNRDYGAYRLRKAYKTSLSIALWIAVLMATSGFTLYRILNTNEAIHIYSDHGPVITIFEQPPPIDKEKPLEKIEPLPSSITTVKFTPPVVKPDDQIINDEIIPTIEDLADATPGLVTHEGVEGGADYTLIDEAEKVVEREKEIAKENFHTSVEIMPSPVGGIAAIQLLITYPEIAVRAGVEGKVIVLAFVDENGNVNDTKIIKGIGAGCDEAAMDAVMKTKFKPGRQQGRTVKVQVSIPVLFKLK